MIINNIKNAFKSIGKSIDKPIFIKAYSDQSFLIERLESMKASITDEDILKSLELDQLLIKQGDIGEKAICYELENSLLPMYCLHDLCLNYDGQTAQMDFVLITSKFIAVLESKKLSGDITINKEGQFTRHFKSQYGKVYKKEAIYSPITQNERHVLLIKKFLTDKKLIKYMPVLSFVVLANPKSIIDMKYAKKEVRDKILRGDQLVARLRQELAKKSDVDMSILSMEEIAKTLLSEHKEKEHYLISKYEESLPTKGELLPTREEICVDYRGLLKSYRLEKSKELNIKAYMIYSNEQLELLLEEKPLSIEMLLKVKGFGPKKAELFGEDIISIFKNNTIL